MRIQATANKPPPSDDTNDNGLLIDLNDTLKTPPVVKDDDAAQSTSSTFYVSKDGQLNEHSWRLPSPAGSSGSPSTVIGAGESLAAEMLGVVMGKEPQQQPRLFATLENVGDELRPKMHVRSPLKLPTLPAAFTGGRAPKSCDSCKQVRTRAHKMMILQMMVVVNTLKDRCYELHDEVGANEDLVAVLRTGLVSAKNQIDSLYVQCRAHLIDFCCMLQ
jgi:hypothetical protein